MVSYINILKALVPFLVMILVIAGFHYTDIIYFKYYPPFMNFLLFVIFFSSLFQEKTIIQRFALALEPDANEHVMRYTRNLTYLWALFMFGNFIISLATVTMSTKAWALYNGVISYFFVGVFFGIEYIVRIYFKRKYVNKDE